MNLEPLGASGEVGMARSVRLTDHCPGINRNDCRVLRNTTGLSMLPYSPCITCSHLRLQTSTSKLGPSVFRVYLVPGRTQLTAIKYQSPPRVAPFWEPKFPFGE